MAEYINRERARFEFERFFKAEEKTQNDCDSLLCMLPTADVVEVVRCSECKYFGKELKQGKHSCLNYQLPYCLGNDYCSYGERRSENENT